MHPQGVPRLLDPDAVPDAVRVEDEVGDEQALRRHPRLEIAWHVAVDVGDGGGRRQDVGGLRQRAPGLLAVELPAAARLRDRGDVGETAEARARLRERAEHDLATGDAGEPVLLLLLAEVHPGHADHQPVHVVGERDGGVASRQLADHLRRLQDVRAHPAVGLGYVEPAQPGVLEGLNGLIAERVVAVALRPPGAELGGQFLRFGERDLELLLGHLGDVHAWCSFYRLAGVGTETGGFEVRSEGWREATTRTIRAAMARLPMPPR